MRQPDKHEMKNRGWILRVAEFLRHEALREIACEIRRLQERGKEYQAMDEDRCIDNFFPFRKEVSATGTYECKAGATIFDASRGQPACCPDLTNKAVSFEHNGNVRVEILPEVGQVLMKFVGSFQLTDAVDGSSDLQHAEGGRQYAPDDEHRRRRRGRQRLPLSATTRRRTR